MSRFIKITRDNRVRQGKRRMAVSKYRKLTIGGRTRDKGIAQ
ncbi:MAG: hypothetical protein O4804_08180 [Trichodesmium sp. St11_bin5]|nr:hypothetical protein [Trichodesmium sp. St11_bin5]